MKRDRAFVLALLPVLVACVPTQASKPLSVADNDPLRRAIVTDVVAVLSEVYETPATALVPVRPMVGSFDSALFAALRDKGFAVREANGVGDRFDSRVDVLEGNMYRVAVTVGTTTLSRVWVLDGANAYAGGAWTRRE